MRWKRRDSNPRILADHRFSKPTHSATLPLFLKRTNLEGTDGRGGIRTPGPLPDFGFQDRRIRPLCHSSTDGHPLDLWGEILIELGEEIQSVFGEEADVGDAALEEDEPLDADAPRVAGVLFGIDTTAFEHFGMDHASAEDLEPSGFLAEVASGATAGETGDVDLEAGLDEGEVGGAKASLHFGAKEGVEEVF